MRVERFFVIENWDKTWEFIKEKIIEVPLSFSALQSEIHGYFDTWEAFGMFDHEKGRYNEDDFRKMVEVIAKVSIIGVRNIHETLPIVFEQRE